VDGKVGQAQNEEKSWLSINKLANVDTAVLCERVAQLVAHMQQMN
jgi:hypothetical protein